MSFGADVESRVERQWEAAVDAMIPHLRSADYTDAVEAGLRRLTTRASVPAPTPRD